MATFDPLNIPRYYRELPHQQAALKLLWETSPKQKEVIELFRANSGETKQEPASTIVKPSQPRQTIKLPGGKVVGLNEPVIANGHFVWSEVLNGDLRRIPKDKSVVANVIKIATELETVRGWFQDRPVKVTSWFRPREINRAVGGASQSTHIQGHAVDISVPGLNPLEVERILLQRWSNRGGVGRGQARGRGFTHLDLRGYRAVWDY